MSVFCDEFAAEFSKQLGFISECDVIDTIAAQILAIRSEHGRLFIVGLGGGAGHASHAACDFRRLCHVDARVLTDNVSEFTARGNDEGWDNVFKNWMKDNDLSHVDGLLVFSVGGGRIDDRGEMVSGSIFEAVNTADEKGATVMGVVGSPGGAVRTSGDEHVVVVNSESFLTPMTEAMQAVVWHMLVSHPLLQRGSTKW